MTYNVFSGTLSPTQSVYSNVTMIHLYWQVLV